MCTQWSVIQSMWLLLSCKYQWKQTENTWKISWFLGKWGFQTIVSSCPWLSAWSGSVFWVADHGWGEPAVPSFSKADALRWTQTELCPSSYQKLPNSMIWSHLFLIPRVVIMASHGHREGSELRRDRVQAGFVFPPKPGSSNFCKSWKQL